MADDDIPDAFPDRRALMRAIGLGQARLDRTTAAAVEALCEEVLVLRDEADQLRAQLQEARLLADHDGLCPVFNRRAFEREVRREIALAGRYHTPLSLIFVDLDRFKEVNDQFGHTVGDEVLLRVSAILMRHVRESDIVGRLGGDEFGIVLSQATKQDSLRKAGQLAQMIDSLVVRDDGDRGLGEVRLGGSCGVVQWQDGQSAGDLIALADQAMFIEKARRKGNQPSVR
jgi:diguanylate cyclase (GGDEF)-like protein